MVITLILRFWLVWVVVIFLILCGIVETTLEKEEKARMARQQRRNHLAIEQEI